LDVPEPEHVQPGPEAATAPAWKPGLLTSALRPAGRASVTVTEVPSVGSCPEFVTVSVRVPPYKVSFGGSTRWKLPGLGLTDTVRSDPVVADAVVDIGTNSANAVPTVRIRAFRFKGITIRPFLHSATRPVQDLAAAFPAAWSADVRAIRKA